MHDELRHRAVVRFPSLLSHVMGRVKRATVPSDLESLGAYAPELSLLSAVLGFQRTPLEACGFSERGDRYNQLPTVSDNVATIAGVFEASARPWLDSASFLKLSDPFGAGGAWRIFTHCKPHRPAAAKLERELWLPRDMTKARSRILATLTAWASASQLPPPLPELQSAASMLATGSPAMTPGRSSRSRCATYAGWIRPAPVGFHPHEVAMLMSLLEHDCTPASGKRLHRDDLLHIAGLGRENGSLNGRLSGLSKRGWVHSICCAGDRGGFALTPRGESWARANCPRALGTSRVGTKSVRIGTDTAP